MAKESNQEKSKRYVAEFQNWVDAHKVDGQFDRDFWTQVLNGSKVKRSEIMAVLGCAKSTVTTNALLVSVIEDLERELQEAGVAPMPGEQINKEPTYDQNKSRAAADTRLIAQLQKEVIDLKTKLKKFERLSEVMDVVEELYEDDL
jgi:hypothetical protein